MKPNKIYQPTRSEETEFCRHIRDLALLGEKTFTPRFSVFLTEREQRLAEQTAYQAGVDCGFGEDTRGFTKNVFRTYCGNRKLPLGGGDIFFRPQDKLTHRDFLGALMSLGLKRDRIGDILVTEGAAAVFASENAVPIISSEIEKIGRVGVKQESGLKIAIPEQEFDEILAVIASNRIDVLVSAACGISREKASALIKSGAVVSNGMEISSASKNIDEGEVFSVKGYGKFVFDSMGFETKKGKNHAIIKKYK